MGQETSCPNTCHCRYNIRFHWNGMNSETGIERYKLFHKREEFEYPTGQKPEKTGTGRTNSSLRKVECIRKYIPLLTANLGLPFPFHLGTGNGYRPN